MDLCVGSANRPFFASPVHLPFDCCAHLTCSLTFSISLSLSHHLSLSHSHSYSLSFSCLSSFTFLHSSLVALVICVGDCQFPGVLGLGSVGSVWHSKAAEIIQTKPIWHRESNGFLVRNGCKMQKWLSDCVSLMLRCEASELTLILLPKLLAVNTEHTGALIVFLLGFATGQ